MPVGKNEGGGVEKEIKKITHGKEMEKSTVWNKSTKIAYVKRQNELRTRQIPSPTSQGSPREYL